MAKPKSIEKTKAFNARLPKDLHTKAMTYRAQTGVSLTAQVVAGLALLYAQKDNPKR